MMMRAVGLEANVGLLGLLQRHALLAALVAVYGGIAFWLTTIHQVNIADGKAAILMKSFATKVPQMIFLVLFGRLIHLTYIQRAEDRIGILKREVVAFGSDRERMISGLIAMCIMTGTLVAFAQLKNLIPLIKPFSWDVSFMELDRLLHFGVLPHEYLHTIFGGHYVISFFTGLYNIWLFMMYFVLVVACFLRPESAFRMQFLIAFVLTWGIGGNLFATMFSSAGPVYYQLLGLGDVYSGLMDRLHQHAATGALTVVETQALLWRVHGLPNGLNGISAFPSMHVASTVLMTFFAFGISRLTGIIATVFTVSIMIGSVLLAWHYAVDGYVGAVIAAASWKLSGWLIRSPIGPFRGMAA
jgi:hypothetical protein